MTRLSNQSISKQISKNKKFHVQHLYDISKTSISSIQTLKILEIFQYFSPKILDDFIYLQSLNR